MTFEDHGFESGAGGLKFPGPLGREVGSTQILYHRAPREPPQGTAIDFI